MTTRYDLDNPKLDSISGTSPRLLLKAFAGRRPTLDDDVEATDLAAAVASTALAERDTRRFKFRVPDGAEYVTPTVTVSYRQPNFLVLQTWEGTVEEIAADSFQARLRDLTDPSRPDEIVEMLMEDVDDADAPLLRPGAVFYWNIGYLEGKGIPRQRTSRVTFRRLPRFLVTSRPAALSVEDIRAALSG